MKIYYLRHADAVPGQDDAERPLSKDGEEEARRMGRYLRNIGIEFEVAFSSPLVRARQTAQIVLKKSDSEEVEVRIADQLLNEVSFSVFRRWLSSLPERDAVLLVGHEPSISNRVARLLCSDTSDAFKFPKAGLAVLETDDWNDFRLRLFVSPKSVKD